LQKLSYTVSVTYNQSVPHTACGVCGHVLNRYTGTFGETWIHVLDSDNDHPAVPVPVESIHTKFMCDFCLIESARWALPVEDYSTEVGGENVGDWAACDVCADLLRKNDWTALTNRAIESMAKRHPGEALSREAFNFMYGQLRQHITGEVRLASKPFR
jgi:hypothetical protein